MKATAAKKFFSMVGAATLVSLPTPCHAAAIMLPWDYTLLAMQDLLVHTIAPCAIGCAFVGSLLVYALGGHDKEASRLFGSGVGGLIALAVVHFLNYVAF